MFRGISGTELGSQINSNIKPKENDNNKSFTKMLKQNLSEVNNLQQKADKTARDFSLGKIDNVHDVTIASEKAEIALNLTTSVQNKVVDSYKEIMRMQV